MNQPPAGTPSFGPPPPPPFAPPPQRSGNGRTVLWLVAGLVLVLAVIAALAFVVLGDDDDKDDKEAAGDGGARTASCESYQTLIMSSEVQAAAGFDPDELQSMYDAVLADVEGDQEFAALVEDEAAAVVPYYRALAEWKQSMEDALSRGEYPETTVPAEITEQQGRLQSAQRGVLEACSDVWSSGDEGDEPIPEITAPTLETPSWMDEQ
jgi:hypothetical protein